MKHINRIKNNQSVWNNSESSSLAYLNQTCIIKILPSRLKLHKMLTNYYKSIQNYLLWWHQMLVQLDFWLMFSLNSLLSRKWRIEATCIHTALKIPSSGKALINRCIIILDLIKVENRLNLT